jgi:arylsulfatase A-like enzyme
MQAGSAVWLRFAMVTGMFVVAGSSVPSMTAATAGDSVPVADTDAEPRPSRQPNVVIIIADDQGWGDVSLHGHPLLKTPHIDSLAKKGARFSHFYVQPVCSPTRAELLTGRWHPRSGVRGVSTGQERLDLNQRTMADIFRAAGYQTGCFGKWHNGSQYPYHPNGRGFDEFYGFTSGHWGHYFSPPLDHNGSAVVGTGYLTDDLTSRAIEFLTRGNERTPKFCLLPLNTPHSPMQVPDRYWQRFHGAMLPAGGPNENIDHTRAALAMCENIDDNVGRLLTALQQHQLTQQTIVVYLSDNGPNGPRWNGGLKGIKGSTDEGGVRSVLHLQWEGVVPAGQTLESIAGAIDLLPTLAALAEVPVPTEPPLDGVSWADWLKGARGEIPDRTLFSHWNQRTSARNQRFRLDANGKLFDLQADPFQITDVSADFPTVRDRLQADVARWKAEVWSGIDAPDQRPYPVGYRVFPRTVLPARDGVPSGGVERSSAAPNCSYFTNWTTTTGAMSWQIDVATPGRYEARVQYTCRPEDTGAVVRLQAGSTVWTTTLTEPHDPPLVGAEQDRAVRNGESLMKPFRGLSLGVADLPDGPVSLQLSATQIPGGRVADVQAVELILLQPAETP